MKIFIITAAYNPNTIWNMIKSIDAQTYTDWEHIIVNDNRLEIREQLEKLCEDKRRHWIDIGFRTHYYGALARNMGIIASFSYIHHRKRDINNEWVCLADDDNMWEPDHLETMVKTAVDNPTATLIVSDRVDISTITGNKVQRMVKFRNGGFDLGQFMYKTKLFREYGYFFPHPARKHKYDWELIMKMINGEGDKIFLTHKPTFLMSYRKPL